MATPWIFYSTMLDRYGGSTLLYQMERDGFVPTEREARTRDVRTLRSCPSTGQREDGIVGPRGRFDIADVTIRKFRKHNDQYHKKVLAEWIHLIELERKMPHTVFILITQYSDLLCNIQQTLESLTIMPINIQRILGKTTLVFYDTYTKCLTAVRDVLAKEPGLEKRDLYEILGVAHMYNRKICPWAPIHYDVSDKQMIATLNMFELK